MGRLSTVEIRQVLKRHPEYVCPVYIETGLMNGVQLLQAAPCFETVHGIELDKHWFEVCKVKTSDLPHVTVHQGDTREILPQLLERYGGTSCFLYLDAHFCKSDPPLQKSEFPLWKELEYIKARTVKDIILVDDVHTFGWKRIDVQFKEGAVEWESVTKGSILQHFGKTIQDSMIVKDSFVLWKKA